MKSYRWPARRGGVAAALALSGALLLGACGPQFEPRQAQFAVSSCDSGAPLDIQSVAWKWQAVPVLGRGAPGEWDSADVLNPSVVRTDDTFYNLYSGFDGKTWHTGLAISSDGSSWEKQGRVLSPDPSTWEADYIAANGSVLHEGKRFLYWYQAGQRGRTRIGLAISSDARSWRKHPEPVLELGAPGTWDEAGLGDPYVIRCGDEYYLFYLGQNRRGLQRLGVARSRDGLHWQKFGANPILDLGAPGSFDERGLGEPAVFAAGGRFYMLYTGRDAGERRRIGWAQSSNGVDWKKVASPSLLEGFSDWNSQVVCDPAVWRDDQRLLVWFGGGDRASPDENLHGQIGLAWLEPRGAGAHVETRE
jgi:predicted GH43/DUF377 family glycosyl hydrolase